MLRLAAAAAVARPRLAAATAGLPMRLAAVAVAEAGAASAARAACCSALSTVAGRDFHTLTVSALVMRRVNNVVMALGAACKRSCAF